MKTVVLIFFHVFRPRYPDLFGMAEPDTVKDERVIPINNQPDQIGIPDPPIVLPSAAAVVFSLFSLLNTNDCGKLTVDNNVSPGCTSRRQ